MTWISEGILYSQIAELRWNFVSKNKIKERKLNKFHYFFCAFKDDRIELPAIQDLNRSPEEEEDRAEANIYYYPCDE